MSVLFTGTNQGTFTSDGKAKILQIRSDLDWMIVKNLTVSYAAGAGTGAEFYWQRGMTQGRGTEYKKTAATNALQVGQIAANAGFYLVDSSINLPGPALSLSAISDASTPVVSTTNTSSLNNGDIVRLFSVTSGLQLNGLDFTIGSVVASTSFTLAYMAQIAEATTGVFRRIPYDPIYYPRNRYITKITQAPQAVVTLSVTHGFTVGQEIRFVVPQVGTSTAYFGMTELDGVQASIIAVDTSANTITVDVDTTGFSAFAFPTSAAAAVGFTPAQVVPIGENTATALSLNANILGDATVNTAYIGIQLQAGVDSPAGVEGNVIYWVAGKSFSNDAQPVVNPE